MPDGKIRREVGMVQEFVPWHGNMEKTPVLFKAGTVCCVVEFHG
jgi:hypothetical protein